MLLGGRGVQGAGGGGVPEGVPDVGGARLLGKIIEFRPTHHALTYMDMVAGTKRQTA